MTTTRRVLVLDDEAIVGDRLKDAFEKEGLEVEVFRDSSQAIERLRDQIFGVLVTDMKMSGPSGMDVLRLVKEKNPSTTVIVITGYATIETNYEAQALGADHFVPKPFKMKDLVKLVLKAFS